MSLQTYVDNLSIENKKNYLSKLQKLNISDPYSEPLSLFTESAEFWPNIDHGDIVNYLVFSRKALTNEQMKAYKSLESHNYFTSGLVNQKILSIARGKKTLLVGEVKHSQSFRSAPLKVWIWAKNCGEVISAHCTCVAGMGAACSHVGAILFAIQTGVRLREDASCTEKVNAWLPPSIKQAPYEQIKNIDFSSSAMKKRKLDSLYEKQVTKPAHISHVPPSEQEFQNFLREVSIVSPTSAILAVLPEHNKNSHVQVHVPNPGMLNIFREEWKSLSWEALLQQCEILFQSDAFVLTAVDADTIEKKTKSQAKSKLWFDYRKGRVTASVMKAVCKTKLYKPSISLLNKICYPLEKNFSTAATVWGCNHEAIARDNYVNKQIGNHNNFNLKKAGFHINVKFPYIGATPDAITSCNCCGKGICEIKCPYCVKDQTVEEMTNRKSCLLRDDAFNLELDKNHAYYYQIQTQLFVCDADFCDFVVWTQESMHIERIYPDMIFWETVLEDATNFFVKCVLPELSAGWFIKNQSIST